VTRRGGVDITLETLPGGTVVVRVDGELDMATTPSLDDALARAGPGERLVLDLTDCTFMDSSAIRTLVTGAQAASVAGGSMSLVVADEWIQRTLQVAGIETMLPVYPTLEAAI
jgi:anti-sigma B factor antagonist